MTAMLRGIDVSNHKMREGLKDLKPLMKSAQFCICKATGGVSFVDSSCDYYVQQLREMGKPWGFYHFANDNGDRSTAEEEARFFVDNCINYFGENQEWVKFVGTFDKDYSGGWINGEGTMWYSDGRVVTGIWEGTTLIEEFSSEQTDPALIRAEAEAARADFFADPIFGEAGL